MYGSRIIFSLFLICLTESKKPNIIIFMADDLGYGDIGAFGNTTIRTPHIDRLAKQGMKFNHMLTPSPLCTPSRAAFLTGRYPVRLGMTGTVHKMSRVINYIASLSRIPSNETTFAEVAKKNGYQTGYIGKWHVGSYCSEFGDFCGHPLRRGFDHFYGCLMSLMKDYGNTGESVILNVFPNYQLQLLMSTLATLLVSTVLWYYKFIGRRIIFFMFIFIFTRQLILMLQPHHGMKFANSILHRNYEVVEMPIRFENLTQRLVWESVEFMENASKQTEKKPFLLFVSWFQVHTVLYNSVPGFRGRSAHGEYGDNVEEMDWSVGQVVNALDRLGLSKDTLVLFTSDNGGHVEETNHLGDRAGGHNGPWRGGKAHGGWDGGYRVPTVIRWPGVVPPGSSSDEPTSNMDVFPTLATIMGETQKPRTDLDGVSLLPLLRGTKRPAPLGERFLFQYCADRIFAVRWRRSDAVWKLRLASPHWLPGTERCDFLCPCYGGVTVHSEPFLHNLDTDPNERYPLDSTGEFYSDIKKRMLEAVRNQKMSIGVVPQQLSSMNFMYRPWLQQCCNFPFCSCKDNKWVR